MPNEADRGRGLQYEGRTACAGATRLVRHAVTFVSEGRKMTLNTNEKAPGACDAEGFDIDTSDDLNFATKIRLRKAEATQVAELAIRGRAAHKMRRWLISGLPVRLYTHFTVGFAALQAFARRLGVAL